MVGLAAGQQLEDETDNEGEGADDDLDIKISTQISHCWMVRPKLL